MEDNRKLYAVTIELSYYAWADNEQKALAFAREAMKDDPLDDVCYVVHDPKGQSLSNWKPDYLVYHDRKHPVRLQEPMLQDCIDMESERTEEPGTPLLDLLPDAAIPLIALRRGV